MKEVVLEEALLAGSNQAIGKRGLQGWIRYGRTTRHSEIQIYRSWRMQSSSTAISELLRAPLAPSKINRGPPMVRKRTKEDEKKIENNSICARERHLPADGPHANM
jgi:hypothetical protein